MQLYSLFPNQNLDSVRGTASENYLGDWLHSFEACMKAQSHQPFDYIISTTCMLLEIHYRAFSIMLDSFPAPDEIKFDSFFAGFVFVLAQSRAVLSPRLSVSDRPDGSRDSDEPRSTDDVGRYDLIPPPLLTATRCRVPYLGR
jgi:hypothetical protein